MKEYSKVLVNLSHIQLLSNDSRKTIINKWHIMHVSRMPGMLITPGTILWSFIMDMKLKFLKCIKSF